MGFQVSSVTSNIPNAQHVENEKTFGLPIKRSASNPSQGTYSKLVPPPPHPTRLSLRSFPEIFANKGTENMHRWDKKGSGRGQAALETAPPSRQSSGPHLGRNHCPAHLHPQVAASRANSPSSYPPARTLLGRWALSGTSRAQERHGGKTKRERSEKKERAGGISSHRPAARSLRASGASLPRALYLIPVTHTHKKARAASPKRLQPALAGAEWRAPWVPSTEAARGRGKWACGLGLAGPRPGSEQSRPAPPTWSWGVARARGAGRASGAPSGQWSPPPPSGAGYKGAERDRAPSRPPVRKVKRRRTRGRRRPSRATASSLSAGARAAVPPSPPRRRGGSPGHKEERDPPRRRHPGLPPPTARASPLSSLTHSSVPQLMAEPEATGAGRLAPRCPLARPDFPLPQARAGEALPR